MASYPSYWTLGWDKNNKLITIPVYNRNVCVSKDNEPLRMAWVVDKIETAAKDREATIVIFDKEKFGLSSLGNKDFGSFQIVNQMVKCGYNYGLGRAMELLELDNLEPALQI